MHFQPCFNERKRAIIIIKEIHLRIIIIVVVMKIAIKTKEMKKRRCLTAASEVYSTVMLLIIGGRGVQFKRTYLD